MKQLWKHKDAWIFHHPVDPVKLGISDYVTIVKKPMDFKTIHNKLKNNQYHKMKNFISDVTLTFDNCLLYNGKELMVSELCNSVRSEFYRLSELKKFADLLILDEPLKESQVAVLPKVANPILRKRVVRDSESSLS